jgi:hypothetical protein
MPILQLLDLTLFEIFKHQGKYQLPLADLGGTINFVYNVQSDLKGRSVVFTFRT